MRREEVRTCIWRDQKKVFSSPSGRKREREEEEGTNEEEIDEDLSILATCSSSKQSSEEHELLGSRRLPVGLRGRKSPEGGEATKLNRVPVLDRVGLGRITKTSGRLSLRIEIFEMLD